MATGIGVSGAVSFGGQAIGSLRNVIDGYNFSRDSVENTVFGTAQTAGGGAYVRTFIPGLFDPGDLALTILYDPDTDTLRCEAAAATLLVDMPGTGSFSCSAFPISESLSLPIDDMMEKTITFKLTGPPTLTVT